MRITVRPNYRTHSFDHGNLSPNDERKLAGHGQCANIPIPRLVISQDMDVQNLNLCAINCQSIRNKADYVVDDIAEHDFDIVAMTEIWLRSDDEDKKVMGDITQSGYKLYSIPRKGRRGGGVALLYKETIAVSDICDETVPSFESLSAAVTTEIGVIRLVVRVAYP